MDYRAILESIEALTIMKSPNGTIGCCTMNDTYSFNCLAGPC